MIGATKEAIDICRHIIIGGSITIQDEDFRNYVYIYMERKKLILSAAMSSHHMSTAMYIIKRMMMSVKQAVKGIPESIRAF